MGTEENGGKHYCKAPHVDNTSLVESTLCIVFHYFAEPQIVAWGSRNGCFRSVESFTCHQCGRSYQMRHNLVKHLRFECGGQKHFACNLCPARYTQNGKLRQHMLNAHNIFVPPRKTWMRSAYSWIFRVFFRVSFFFFFFCPLETYLLIQDTRSSFM